MNYCCVSKPPGNRLFSSRFFYFMLLFNAICNCLFVWFEICKQDVSVWFQERLQMQKRNSSSGRAFFLNRCNFLISDWSCRRLKLSLFLLLFLSLPWTSLFLCSQTLMWNRSSSSIINFAPHTYGSQVLVPSVDACSLVDSYCWSHLIQYQHRYRYCSIDLEQFKLFIIHRSIAPIGMDQIKKSTLCTLVSF